MVADAAGAFAPPSTAQPPERAVLAGATHALLVTSQLAPNAQSALVAQLVPQPPNVVQR
jgi:hypothetical protein